MFRIIKSTTQYPLPPCEGALIDCSRIESIMISKDILKHQEKKIPFYHVGVIMQSQDKYNVLFNTEEEAKALVQYLLQEKIRPQDLVNLPIHDSDQEAKNRKRRLAEHDCEEDSHE